jgi:hypothetical protein
MHLSTAKLRTTKRRKYIRNKRKGKEGNYSW